MKLNSDIGLFVLLFLLSWIPLIFDILREYDRGNMGLYFISTGVLLTLAFGVIALIISSFTLFVRGRYLLSRKLISGMLGIISGSFGAQFCLGGLVYGCEHYREQGNTIVEHIEVYKQNEGKLPSNINDLPVVVESSRHGDWQYTTNGDNYELWIGSYAIDMWSFMYKSNRNGWHCDT